MLGLWGNPKPIFSFPLRPIAVFSNWKAMIIFVLAVLLVLLVSAFCSLSEASLYSVRRPYLRKRAEEGSYSAKILLGFKDNIERPISAILIVNTVANTAGASLAGAEAQMLFGKTAFIWFSLAFAIAVLVFSEIFPKILGVAYNQSVANAIAIPWAVAVKLLSPMVILVDSAAKLVKPRRVAAAPEEEVQQMAMISAEEGSIMPYEAELVRNALGLDKTEAREIMTPRSVVTRLPAGMTLQQAYNQLTNFTYSRIPIFDADNPDTWTGIVLSRDILSGIADEQSSKRLEQICKPIYFVTENTPGHVLLRLFLKRRTHLFVVVGQPNIVSGIVTLEDVLEAILGQEIVDEVDVADDMQELARKIAGQTRDVHPESDTPQNRNNGNLGDSPGDVENPPA